jgi:hypothetical protein
LTEHNGDVAGTRTFCSVNVPEGQRELGGAEREIDFGVVGKSKLEADTESRRVRERAVALVAENARLAVHAGSVT